MSKISVIIPVYNHIKALKKSLASLKLQTLQPDEVILVDDGSEDGDVEEAIKKANLPFKFVYVKQKNAGAAAARNAGYKLSTGELIIFWDADTIARPEMLEKLKRGLDNHPEAGYAYCSYFFGWKRMPGREFNARELSQNNFIDTTSLIRRSALEGVSGPFDQNLKRFQDWDLWLTLLEKGRTGVFVPEFLFKKSVGFRKGISSWLPKIFYKFPFKMKKKATYEAARKIVLTKHGLPM